MKAIQFSKQQAGRFLLRKHRLLGGYPFAGKEGVLDFIRQAGCVQSDPVDVCGKNTDQILLCKFSSNRRKYQIYDSFGLETKFSCSLLF